MRGAAEIAWWLRQSLFSESGSAMVETALTLPIFLAMLLGAVELGDLAYKANETTNAARAAGQYATAVGGGYTDCNGSVPGTTPVTCSTSSGMYMVAKTDAPLVTKACTSFTLKAATSCVCSDSTSCTSSSTSGYACASGKPVITVSTYTSAQCSPAASVPNLFPVGGLFTINGVSQQEVTE